MIHYLCAMARIIGIDYGTKRIGIATTDPLQIIASPLETVATPQIFDYLTQYFFTEEVERIIVGEPKKLDDTDGDILPQVRRFVERLNQLFPNIPVDMQDERYTSREAQRIIINSGIKKMKRRDKALVDKISASIILEEWMKSSGKWNLY
jgi:putative holliday junction resolvase